MTENKKSLWQVFQDKKAQILSYVSKGENLSPEDLKNKKSRDRMIGIGVLGGLSALYVGVSPFIAIPATLAVIAIEIKTYNNNNRSQSAHSSNKMVFNQSVEGNEPSKAKNKKPSIPRTRIPI